MNRAGMGDAARAPRILVVANLDPHGARAIERWRRPEEGARDIVLVTGDISARPETVEVVHLADRRFASGEVRDRAVAFVHRLGLEAKLADGRSLLAALRRDGVSLWWLAHLHLHEPAIALLDAVERSHVALETLEPAEVVLLDEHDRRASLVSHVAELRGVPVRTAPRDAVRDNGPPEAAAEPRELHVRLPPRYRVRRAIARTLSSVSRGAGLVLSPVGSVVVRLLVLVARLLAIFFRLPLYVPAGLLYVAAMALGVLTSEEYWLVRRLRAGGARLVAFAEEVVRRIHVGRGRLRRDAWMPRFAAMGRAIARLLARRRGDDVGPRGAAVLFTSHAGDVRARLDLERGRVVPYYPYLEGLRERLAERLGKDEPQIWTLGYGTDGRGRGFAGWALSELRAAFRPQFVTMAQMLTDDTWAARSSWAQQMEHLIDALRDDVVFREHVQHQGVPLWTQMRPVLEQALRTTADNVLMIEAYRGVLGGSGGERRLAVSAGFEGPFRPLTVAAAVDRVPLVGVQYTLGPNAQGLDQRMMGYRSSDGGGLDACPIPNRIAVWSDHYRDRLVKDFGYDPDVVEVCGYARLDAFATAERHAVRPRALAAIGQAEPHRSILFSSVLHAGGATITTEEDWAAALEILVDVATSRGDTTVLVKPWAGDRLDRVRRLTARHGGDVTRYVPPDVLLHNVDLLATCDVSVGTLSSIHAEAVVMGVACILVDLDQARAYFGDRYSDHFHEFCRPVTTLTHLKSAVLEALDETTEDRKRHRQAVGDLFGPVDGRSLDRLTAYVRRQLEPPDSEGPQS